MAAKNDQFKVLARFQDIPYFTFLSGNASDEPGPSYDAHAWPAALHAPSWHDASPRNGTWSDATRCHASRRHDARTDAWSDASAGSVCKHVDLSLIEHVPFVPWLFCFDLLAFVFTGCRKPSQSHPLPHQPTGGDERAYAVHALQPVSNFSASHIRIRTLVEHRV